MSRQRSGQVVLALLGSSLVAAWLRCWHLGWGLAGPRWFFDEFVFGLRAAAFVPLSCASFALRPNDFGYPTLYGYLAGGATSLAHGLGLLDEVRPAAPGVLGILRGVSALAGIATVGLVGLAGVRLYGKPVGLGAAALIAVAPLHAMQAHVASTDVLLTAWVPVALLTAWRLGTGGAASSAVAAGAVAGLAFATKYTGLALLAPAGWAVAESAWQARSPARLVGLGGAALAGFAVTAALACPPCALHAGDVLTTMDRARITTSSAPQIFANNHLVSALGWYGRPYLYELVASLPYGLGWPLALMALLGVGIAVWRRELADRIVLASVVPYFLVMGGSAVVFPRYLLPLFPGLVILAARAAFAVGTSRQTSRVLLAGVWTYSFLLAVTQVARFAADQQQAVAEWIAAARPSGAPTRVVVATRSHLMLVYFRMCEALLRARLPCKAALDGHWFDSAPDVIVVPEWYAIAIRRDVPDGPAARDLERLETGAAGYHEAARWRSRPYLQREFYTWLDPAFAGDLWQGDLGFAVYLKGPDPRRTLESGG